jgi:hypothetical protein
MVEWRAATCAVAVIVAIMAENRPMPPNSTDTDPPSAVAHALSVWQRSGRFVRSKLTWNRVYRATSYLKSAL